MLAAIVRANFTRIYHLGVIVDKNTPAWGDRSHNVTIRQIPCPDSTVFNDDSQNASVGIGTHVDGLGHCERDDTYYAGYSKAEVYHKEGVQVLGLAENVPFFIAKFKMLDMAAYYGVEIVDREKEYSSADIEGAAKAAGITFNAGDIILLRSGWTRHLNDPETFNLSEPGPGLDAATYLGQKKPLMIAGDTVGLEVHAPGLWTDYPVHNYLLREEGIYIGEVFNLEELALDNVTQGTIVIPITQTAGLCQVRCNPLCFV
ncbi:cyclase [Gracilaria domingensis]|nr:cyclase [Gracilaria domingensis]